MGRAAQKAVVDGDEGRGFKREGSDDGSHKARRQPRRVNSGGAQ
jgi:hypothetical protein